MNDEGMRARVLEELARIADEQLKRALEAYLVAPRACGVPASPGYEVH
jgi:hypothetical protein